MILVVEGRDTFNLVSRLHIAETAGREMTHFWTDLHILGPDILYNNDNIRK